MVGYPTPGEEASVVGRSLRGPVAVERRLDLSDLEQHRRTVAEVFVDRDVVGYAVALADATRRPSEHGLSDLVPFVEYGASPRGPIGLVHSARALAVLRGRRHVVAADVRDLAADVLRHRLVLSYDALAEGVTADDILSRVIDAIPLPAGERRRTDAPPADDRYAA
jgi:MoxR-like ATPase